MNTGYQYRVLVLTLAAVSIAFMIGGITFNARPAAHVLWAGAALTAFALIFVSWWGSWAALKSTHPAAEGTPIPTRAILRTFAAPLSALAAVFISLSFLSASTTTIATLRICAAIAAFVALITVLIGSASRAK